MVPGWYASAFLCWIPAWSGIEVKVESSIVEKEDSNVEQDIHNDEQVLQYLRVGSIGGNCDAKERDRILQRAKRFRWEGSQVLRVWSDGKVRVVPKPSQCVALVQHSHEELGHFGVKRTYSLLQTQYWWHGMHTDVQQ